MRFWVRKKCLKHASCFSISKTALWSCGMEAVQPLGITDRSCSVSAVEPAPPVLVLTQTEEILSANATYQLPPCMPPLDLKYEVAFWKEGAGNKVGNSFPAPRLGPLLHPFLLRFFSPSQPAPAHLLQEAFPEHPWLLAVSPNKIWSKYDDLQEACLPSQQIQYRKTEKYR